MRHRQPRKGPEKRTGNQNPKAISPRYRANVQPQGVEGERRMEQQAQDQHQGTQDDKGQQPGRIPVGRPQARKADAAR